jgi:hypothetical protein
MNERERTPSPSPKVNERERTPSPSPKVNERERTPSPKGEDPKAKQIVFVDFNNIVGGVFPVLFFDLSGDNILGGVCFEAHTYSDVEQEAILEKMTLDFAEFSVAFTVKKPEEGDYATIKFNTNVVELDKCTGPGELALGLHIDCTNFDPCFIRTTRLGFGRAQGIDFRNKVLNDLSIVDVSFWKVRYLLQECRSFPDISKPHRVAHTLPVFKLGRPRRRSPTKLFRAVLGQWSG